MKKLLVPFHTVFLAVLFVLIFPTLTLGEKVTLAWNPNSETNLDGYKIYYGNSSRNYDVNIDVGNVTEYKVLNLTEGETYYFAATAYDTSDNESDFSDEIFTTIPVSDPEGSLTRWEPQSLDVTNLKGEVVDTEPPYIPLNLRDEL